MNILINVSLLNLFTFNYNHQDNTYQDRYIRIQLIVIIITHLTFKSYHT